MIMYVEAYPVQVVIGRYGGSMYTYLMNLSHSHVYSKLRMLFDLFDLYFSLLCSYYYMSICIATRHH
jgi:hypothetical protein